MEWRTGVVLACKGLPLPPWVGSFYVLCICRLVRGTEASLCPLCCAGREGRDFGAKSKLKKNKTGGLSNRFVPHLLAVRMVRYTHILGGL